MSRDKQRHATFVSSYYSKVYDKQRIVIALFNHQHFFY
jgi:hypothetical protein